MWEASPVDSPLEGTSGWIAQSFRVTLSHLNAQQLSIQLSIHRPWGRWQTSWRKGSPSAYLRVPACARGWYYSHPCCGLNCVPPKWQHLEIRPLWRLVRLNGVIRLGPNPIGLMSLSEEKEKPELSAFRRTRRKGHVRTQLGREPSTGSNPDCTLGLDFQPPEPRKSKCVV